MRINGSSSKNNYSFYADVTEIIPSDYVSTNKTKIEYHVYIKNNGTRFNSNNWTKYAQVDSSDVYRQTGQNINSTAVGYNDAMEIMSGTKEIQHNADGSKTITFSAVIEKSSYTSYDPGRCSLSGTMALTTIPRASVPTTTNGNIEESMTIYTNRKSSSFTHTLTYSFGSLTGTIATGVGDSYSWTIPSSFYTQIPSSQNGTGIIYCTTYNGGTQIGSTQSCYFTAYVKESINKPTLSLDVVDTNTACTNLTGSNKRLVKYISNAQATLTATANNSASMVSTSISTTTGTQTGTGSITKTFNNVESASFTASGTDSRGYTNTTTATGLTLVEYEKLSLNPVEFYRTSQTNDTLYVRGSGNYFNSNFGSTNNSITFKVRKSGDTDWTTKTVSVTSGQNGYTFDFSLGTYDYQQSHTFEFQVNDKLMTLAIATYSSQPGIPVMGLYENYHEAFGTKTFEKTSNGSTINGDLKISGSNDTLNSMKTNISTNTSNIGTATTNINSMINDLYYKSADRMIIYTPGSSVLGKTIVSSYVSNNSSEFGFSITTEKSMKNVTPSIEHLGLNVRKSNGGYVGATGYTEGGVNFRASDYTVYLNKINNNTIGILVRHNGAFNDITNNTPLSIEINYLQILFS